MAKARPIPGLAAAARFGDAAAAAVETRAREVSEHAAEPMDVDGVHDARVATRRLRAALEIFAPSFPRKRHKRLLREVKALADALGARRDPDVALGRLEKLAGDLPEHEAAEIRGLIGELRDEQSAGRERVAQALAEARESDLEGRLLALATEARQ